MVKTENTYVETAERITRVKKFQIPCKSIEFNIQDPYYIK